MTTLALEIEVGETTEWTPKLVDGMARAAGNAFRVKFNEMYCEQAGHEPWDVPHLGTLCKRCQLHLGDN